MFYNRESFLAAYAGQIEAIDKARDIELIKLDPEASLQVLGTIGYGNVRAADIWNLAYKKLQFSRRVAIAAGATTMVITNPIVVSIDLITHTYLPTLLLGGGAISIGGALAAGLFSRRMTVTAKKFQQQFNPDIETGPVDKALSRKAVRLVSTYIKDKVFAQNIPYGEGVASADPVAMQRDIHIWDKHIHEPSDFSRLEATEHQSLMMRQFVTIRPVTDRNVFDFDGLVYAHLINFQHNNPGFTPIRKDEYELRNIYYKAYKSITDRRSFWSGAQLMAGIIPSAVLWPIAAQSQAGVINPFILNHMLSIMLVSACPLLSGAGYLAVKNVLSRRIYKKQIINARAVPDAPSDPAVAVRADKALCQGLRHFAEKRGLKFHP